MPQSPRRPHVIAALMFAAGTALSPLAPALAADGPGHTVALASARGATEVRLDGKTVRTTAARVSGQRVFAFRGSRTVVAAWDETGAAGRTPWFALSLDGGATAAQVMPAGNLVRLRYAEFDPTLGEPSVPKALQADASNELFLVQFACTPLEEMRQEIRARGGVVLSFLTDNTHIIRMTPEVRAQVAALPYIRWTGPMHPAYRVDEETRQRIVSGEAIEGLFSIAANQQGLREQNALADLITRLGGKVSMTNPDQYRMEATLNRDQLLAVLRRNETAFVDPSGPMTPDMNLIRQQSGAVPLLSTAGFLGQGVRGEVFDTHLEMAHQQWNGQTPLLHGSANVDAAVHGSSCYGINFATGTGNLLATGMVPQREQGIFYHYRNSSQSGFGGTQSRLAANTEAVNPAGPYRSSYQSSSIGSAQITNYSTISAEVDDYLFRVDYLSCQSQSNTGDRNSRPQAWAKNIVSVGGMELGETLARTNDTWASGASFGPASDLRVKPDLSHSFSGIFTTTDGVSGYTQFSGTSGATPIVAGHFGLLMQMWHEGVFTGFGGGASVFADRPKSTTAKALMINGAFRYSTATGFGNANITERQRVGWGMADLTKLYNDRAKFFIVNQGDIITNGQTRTYTRLVAAGEPEVRATLVYPDPMGSTSAAQQRINDLSLKVTAPNGTIYWGNNGMVPTAIPSAVNVNYTTPGGSANTYDTVENVFVQNPPAGVWTFEVVATQIVQDGYPSTPALDAVYSLVVSNVSQPLVMSLPSGAPPIVPPGQPFSVPVTIQSGSQNVVPGSAMAWYRSAGAGSFASAPLVALGGPDYRADFPAPLCADTPQFYFTASGDQGATAAAPATAPADFYSTAVGTTTTTALLSESFESGIPSEWSATGLWHAGNACATGPACDGALWAYYGQDATCTYNTGAHTTGQLISPPITLPVIGPGGSVTLTYCSAKESENNTAYDLATVLVNGTELVDTAPDSATFATRTVDLTAYGGQTVSLVWNFDSIDETLNDFRGWQVDNVRVITTFTSCTNPAGGCYANCDHSAALPVLNILDFTCFLQKFAEGDPYANCDGSTTQPTLNVQDFTCFLGKFAQGCP